MKASLPVSLALIVTLLAGPALAEPKSAASIPKADLVQPADLAASLKNAPAQKPLLLHVGFHILYTQAHIPGSEYVGPASEEAGSPTAAKPGREAAQGHPDRHLLRLLPVERLPEHRRGV